MYRIFFKVIFDFIFALVGLIILSPFIIIVCIGLLITYKGGNVFFIQDRPGKNCKIFKLIKFRTMSEARDNNGELLKDSERITHIGKILRSTSVDELPQLINVLKGDMSFVGPRPLLKKYIPLYSKEQMRRHEVRPGITGWVQVNGRNSNSWSRKFELDIWYVDHLSLFLDLKILLLSIVKVFLRKDINKEGEATTVPFTGNN